MKKAISLFLTAVLLLCSFSFLMPAYATNLAQAQLDLSQYTMDDLMNMSAEEYRALLREFERVYDPFDTYDTNPIMEEEETPPRIAPRWASGNIENGEYVEQGSHEYITAKACDILTKDKGFFSMNESANVFIVLAISIASLTPDKDENKNIFEGHFYHAIDGDSWTGSKTNTALVNCRNHFDSAVHAAKVGDIDVMYSELGRALHYIQDAGEPLKFHLITDLHHYAASLGTTGSAYEWRSQSDQKCLAETGAIIDAAVDWLLQSEIDIILVAGDVSCDGEKESHLELIPKLNRLREAGKRVILITATHDYSETPIRCVGDERLPATPTTREELLELYHDFGLNEAIAFHAETHSYAVQLAPGWRMLALNDDGDGRAFCGYSEDQLHWILDQVKLAHEAGDEVLAMTHHPVLPPSPIYPLFSRRDMLGDFEHTSTVLADAGVQFIFTGHTHMQNIAVKTTEKGNTIYDINTSALIGYASAIRTVAVYDDRMEVTSDHIDHFDWDLHGMTVDEYFKSVFDRLLNDIFDSMAFDIERLSRLAGGFSVEAETILKLRVPLTLAGRALHKLTVGQLARLLCISRDISPEVKPILLKDLFVEVVRNIYRGDEPYTPDTPVYQAIKRIMERISPLVRRMKNSEEIFKMMNVILDGVLYDAPPADNDAILPRMAWKQ